MTHQPHANDDALVSYIEQVWDLLRVHPVDTDQLDVLLQSKGVNGCVDACADTLLKHAPTDLRPKPPQELEAVKNLVRLSIIKKAPTSKFVPLIVATDLSWIPCEPGSRPFFDVLWNIALGTKPLTCANLSPNLQRGAQGPILWSPTPADRAIMRSVLARTSLPPKAFEVLVQNQRWNIQNLDTSFFIELYAQSLFDRLERAAHQALQTQSERHIKAYNDFFKQEIHGFLLDIVAQKTANSVVFFERLQTHAQSIHDALQARPNPAIAAMAQDCSFALRDLFARLDYLTDFDFSTHIDQKKLAIVLEDLLPEAGVRFLISRVNTFIEPRPSKPSQEVEQLVLRAQDMQAILFDVLDQRVATQNLTPSQVQDWVYQSLFDINLTLLRSDQTPADTNRVKNLLTHTAPLINTQDWAIYIQKLASYMGPKSISMVDHVCQMAPLSAIPELLKHTIDQELSPVLLSLKSKASLIQEVPDTSPPPSKPKKF